MLSEAPFTRGEIINADFQILREKDISAVAARQIGSAPGNTARPILTVCANRGEMLDEIDKFEQKAHGVYSDYVRQGLKVGGDCVRIDYQEKAAQAV